MAFTLEPEVQVLYGFVDRSGHRASMSVYMDNTETDPDAGGPAAVASAAQAISDDALTSVEVRIRGIEGSPGTPSDGPYARGADKALFVFSASDGSPVNMQIGAPQETIFGAGAIEIDPTDSLADALIDAMVAHAKTAEGNAITGFKRGYRRRPPRREHQ